MNEHASSSYFHPSRRTRARAMAEAMLPIRGSRNRVAPNNRRRQKEPKEQQQLQQQQHQLQLQLEQPQHLQPQHQLQPWIHHQLPRLQSR